MWEPCDGCGPKEKGFIVLGDRMLCKSCYLAAVDAVFPGVAAAAVALIVNGWPVDPSRPRIRWVP